jgi:hemolysin III
MMPRNKAETFNAFSHGLAALAGVAATLFLAARARTMDATLFIMTAISGAGVTFLFAASFLFHLNKRSDDEISPWLRLDHIAIFIMMVACFMAPLYIYAPRPLFARITAALVAFSLLGCIVKMKNMSTPNWFNALVYAPLGLAAFIPMSRLWSSYDGLVDQGVDLALMKLLLVAGLCSYALGGILYALKFPAKKNTFLGFHELFHLLVMAGAFFHLIALHYSIEAYPLIRSHTGP